MISENPLDYVGGSVSVITPGGWIDRKLQRDEIGLFVVNLGQKLAVRHKKGWKFTYSKELQKIRDTSED